MEDVMEEEKRSLAKNDTWECANLSVGKKVVGCNGSLL